MVIRLFPDTVQNLLKYDKFYMLDEDFFGANDPCEDLDSWIFYTMDVEKNTYMNSYYTVYALALRSDESECKLMLMDLPMHTPIVIETNTEDYNNKPFIDILTEKYDVKDQDAVEYWMITEAPNVSPKTNLEAFISQFLADITDDWPRLPPPDADKDDEDE